MDKYKLAFFEWIRRNSALPEALKRGWSEDTVNAFAVLSVENFMSGLDYEALQEKFDNGVSTKEEAQG